MKGLRSNLYYWLAQASIGVTRFFPALPYWIIDLLTPIYFVIAPRRKVIALRNLRNALPDLDDRARLKLARRGAASAFKVVVDLAIATRWIDTGRDLHEVVDVSDLRAKMPSSGGWLALTGHMGSWEMGAVGVALAAGEVDVITRTLKNERMQAALTANRRKVGLRIHPRRGGLRMATRALKEGRPVLMAVDQNQRHRGVFVPFFGEMASTERSAVTLAMRYQVPIVVGRMQRIGRGFRFKIHVDEPYVPAGNGEDDEVREAAAEVNRRLERHILSAPDQYLWVHNRYKTRPPAEPDTVANSEQASEAS